ncbi:MAG TPA: energy transducer TonB, partial [Burkholderiales bacterium]|nr:energy transducer TonB [Burkholderiales bacterium]
VLLRVLVTREGRAARVELDKSSGFPLLDNAALEGVREWRFVPARKAAEPVEDWVRVPIVFRLVDAQ